MKFYIASRKSDNIAEILKQSNISCSHDANDKKEIGDCNHGIAIKIVDMNDLTHIQEQVQDYYSKHGDRDQIPLVIDFIKQEIVLYDFYMD